MKYNIFEVKTKSGIGNNLKEEKELVYTGTTDANGKALYEFKAIENCKFSYEIYFDYSNMQVPTGEYDLSKTRDFDYLKKNEINKYEFDILPYVKLISHTKNINCTANRQNENKMEIPLYGIRKLELLGN
jgi:hypothetical protein